MAPYFWPLLVVIFLLLDCGQPHGCLSFVPYTLYSIGGRMTAAHSIVDIVGDKGSVIPTGWEKGIDLTQ